MRRSEDPFDFIDDDRDTMFSSTASRLGSWMFSRPGSAAAIVGFVTLFGFVSSNALWHQTEAHSNAFFNTRALPDTRLASQPTAPEGQLVAPQPIVVADQNVARVQTALKALRLYDGAIDGVIGTRTRNAIVAYQTILQVEPTGLVDQQLLALLDAGGARGSQVARSDEPVPAPRAQTPDYEDVVASITPTPSPRRVVQQAAPVADSEPAAAKADPKILQLQAGLKQFGNPDMVVDGLMGSQTRKAIREFQMIFRLPETGEPDAAVFAELRRQGFID